MAKFYKHLKTGGIYERLSDALNEADLVPVTVYRSVETGQSWVRRTSEFEDGRFIEVPNPTEVPVTATYPSLPPVDFMSDMRDFHEKFNLRYEGPCRSLPIELFHFRHEFMGEEMGEWEGHTLAARHELLLTEPDLANYQYHLEESLDGLIDLVYVTMGNAYLQGFGPIFNEGWRRVHEANMSKVRAGSAKDSKRNSPHDVVKPEGWTKPTHTDLIEINELTVKTLED